VTLASVGWQAKEEIIARIGRSPDKGDRLVYAHRQTSMPCQGLLDYMREMAAERRQAG
jgi:hypothetical protein